jgi:hypothetical protein
MQYKIDDTQFIYLLDTSLVKEKYILFNLDVGQFCLKFEWPYGLPCMLIVLVVKHTGIIYIIRWVVYS